MIVFSYSMKGIRFCNYMYSLLYNILFSENVIPWALLWGWIGAGIELTLKKLKIQQEKSVPVQKAWLEGYEQMQKKDYYYLKQASSKIY